MTTKPTKSALLIAAKAEAEAHAAFFDAPGDAEAIAGRLAVSRANINADHIEYLLPYLPTDPAPAAPHITTDDTADCGNFIKVAWPAKDGAGYDPDPDTGTTGYPSIAIACAAVRALGFTDYTIGTDISAIEVERHMSEAA